jgi:hypothetical protein
LIVFVNSWENLCFIFFYRFYNCNNRLNYFKMSSGFYLVSGMMYINLGCEAMFVLANRMRAQNVDMKSGNYFFKCSGF